MCSVDGEDKSIGSRQISPNSGVWRMRGHWTDHIYLFILFYFLHAHWSCDQAEFAVSALNEIKTRKLPKQHSVVHNSGPQSALVRR